MNLKAYNTALESCEPGEIQNILNRKAEMQGSHATCDYIGRSLDNIANSKERVAQAIKELQAIKKQFENQEEVIKVGVAKWLGDNGIDRIEGDLVSSITTYEKASSHEVVIENEADIDVVYCKLVPDKTKIKQAILSGEIVNGASLMTIHNEQSVKLNRKKVKVEETLPF
jgi:hypothetical protein